MSRPGADLVAGIDARGFLIAGAVAARLGTGVLAIRKGGKLPPPVRTEQYTLEYGTASLELPADGIELAGRSVVILDDVLATGGTVAAAQRLLEHAGAEVTIAAVVVELAGLGGREVARAAAGAQLALLCSSGNQLSAISLSFGGDQRGGRQGDGGSAAHRAAPGRRHCAIGRSRRIGLKASSSASRRVRARLARRMTAQRSTLSPVLEPLVAVHREIHPKADLALLQRAYEVAEQRHAGQLRHSGDPYITHPLAVANILAELGMDTTTLVAALLHDTVEDTGYTLEALSADFGDEVGHLVDGVTKLDKVGWAAPPRPRPSAR